MRIIAGKYKGRRFKMPKLSGTRPTLDRVKESLFNILHGRFAGGTVLDLFAGLGSLGLEALSRGAKKVVFNDKDGKAAQSVRDNLTALKVPEEEYAVLNYDYRDALRSLKNKNFKADVIFLDPPYGTDLAEEALEKIEEYGLLAEDGVVVVEESRKKELQNPPGQYIIKDKRTYGAVDLYFLEEKD
jgi:16S rRNA (guanine966-N2)-methyltransferase